MVIECTLILIRLIIYFKHQCQLDVLQSHEKLLVDVAKL